MNYTKLANGVSWGLHPFILPIYILLVLFFATAFEIYTPNIKIYLTGVVVLYTIVIPALSLVVLRSMGYISSYKIDERSERMLPLIIGAVCYILCAITISKIPMAIFIRKFLIAAACCELLTLFISQHWKISLHLTGMGALVGLFFIMNLAGVGDLLLIFLLSILCAGILATARLYLGCHNGAQVLAGFIGGFVICVLSMLFL